MLHLDLNREIDVHSRLKKSGLLGAARLAAGITITMLLSACNDQAGPAIPAANSVTSEVAGNGAAITTARSSESVATIVRSTVTTTESVLRSSATTPSATPSTPTVTSLGGRTSVTPSTPSARTLTPSGTPSTPITPLASIDVCPSSSTCVELAHESLSGGMEIKVESRDTESTVVTEEISNRVVAQKTFRYFGSNANLECASAGGTSVCSLSGVPGGHVSFAAIFSVSPGKINTLSTNLYGEGDFYLTSLEDGHFLLTTVKLFTDGGLAPALAPAAWETWDVTDDSVSLTGCGLPTADRSGARPTSLLHNPCSGAATSSASPTAAPGDASTTIAAAPGVGTGEDPAIDGPVSAGTPADLSNYQDRPTQIAATFTSPSGNINCKMYEDYPNYGNKAVCSISEHLYKGPAGLSGGACGAGDSVEVSSAEGAHAPAVCTVGPVGAGLAVLPFGQSLTFAGITCLSTKSGIKCMGTDGAGFVISQRKIALYD